MGLLNLYWQSAKYIWLNPLFWFVIIVGSISGSASMERKIIASVSVFIAFPLITALLCKFAKK